MEYLVDPDAEEESQPVESNPDLQLKDYHFPWLLYLINSAYSLESKSDGLSKHDSVHFCVSCSRYLTRGEDATSHQNQLSQGPHNVLLLMRVPFKDHGSGNKNFYVGVRALRDQRVPIGDILSHVLPYPAADGLGDGMCRCLYVHPQNSRESLWHGDVLSGRCAYRQCERVFNDKQSHLKLYGITPQFCSMSCKVNTWHCCNRYDFFRTDGIFRDRPGNPSSN